MYCGTPDEVVEKVRRVHRETGITNISFTMFGVTDKPRVHSRTGGQGGAPLHLAYIQVSSRTRGYLKSTL